MLRFFKCCRKEKPSKLYFIEAKEEKIPILDIDEKQNYRELPHQDQLSAAGKQILAAINWQTNPREFKIENLNEDELEIIARSTNNAAFHYTANCPILSIALMYNLKIGRTDLCIDNVYPLYKPTNNITANEIVFGEQLAFETYQKNSTANELTQKILNIYKSKGERIFFVSIDFSRKLGIGHCFNAVVLGNDTNLRVVFVDAWKTLRKTVNTFDEFEKSYSSSYEMYLFTSPSKIKCLKKPTPQFDNVRLRP